MYWLRSQSEWPKSQSLPGQMGLRHLQQTASPLATKMATCALSFWWAVP